jgi:hypothetical protein
MVIDGKYKLISLCNITLKIETLDLSKFKIIEHSN